MKPTEEARGQPLVGAAAKVTDGFFWVALSAAEADIVRRISSLRKGQDWIDLPFVYDTGQRAILTFEKGKAGDDVFSKAIAAWTPEATRFCRLKCTWEPSSRTRTLQPVAPIPLLTLRGNSQKFQAIVMQVQNALHLFGYSVPIDGTVGDETRAALIQFQNDWDLKPTGTITPKVLDALGIEAR